MQPPTLQLLSPLTALTACLYLLSPGTADAATTYVDTLEVLNCNRRPPAFSSGAI